MKAPTLGDHFSGKCEERQTATDDLLISVYDIKREWAQFSEQFNERLDRIQDQARKLEKTLK